MHHLQHCIYVDVTSYKHRALQKLRHRNSTWCVRGSFHSGHMAFIQRRVNVDAMTLHGH